LWIQYTISNMQASSSAIHQVYFLEFGDDVRRRSYINWICHGDGVIAVLDICILEMGDRKDGDGNIKW